MKVDLQKLPNCLKWGAFWGAAAWSAYAVVEFVFSSLVFRVTRPYAVFTPWHWHLTGLLILAYLLIGPVTGALGGLAVYFLRERFDDDTDALRVLESAATIPVALLLTVNGILVAFSEYGFSSHWEAVAGVVFVALLVAGV